MKCPSIAMGAVWPRLLQMVKTDTRKAGKGHGKTKNDKKEKVLNTPCHATYREIYVKNSSRITS